MNAESVLAELSNTQTVVVAVGGAIIVLAAVAMGYKWVKGMLFS